MTKRKNILIIAIMLITPSFSLLAQSINIKIMSFNIQQPHGTNWDARKDSAVAIIIQEDVDIIGTQEAVNYQRDYIIDSTKGYAWYGLGRDGGDKGEGSWIFYKEGKYLIDSLNSGNFWLSDTPDKPSRFAGNYNRICTYIRLIDTATQKGFYVFNAHFPIPNLSTGRLKSMKLMAQRMAEKSLSGEPVIATGDFNSSENDAATKWMKNGSDNPIHCRDTYRDVYPEGHVSTGFGTKFDYIYYENIPEFKTIDSWVIKEPSEATDHFPIAAEISFFFENDTNQFPVAHAGIDQYLQDTNKIGSIDIFLDASASFDPDGKILKVEWALGDDIISTQISSTVNLPLGNHPIYLTVTDNLGAKSTDQVSISIHSYIEPVNIKYNIPEKILNIYPSPTKGLINMSTNNGMAKLIRLYNMNGQKVEEKANASFMDISHLPNGIYIIEVFVNDEPMRSKIIKE